MLEINISKTKEKNSPLLSLPFEIYIACVTASEIGNAPLEACKAQAVAARTNALPYLQNGKPIPAIGVQAFRADRLDKTLYPNAYQGAGDTEGEVLTYNGALLSPCSFSASNGGRTTSSAKRWGGFRPYLIEQDDPYDLAATNGKKTGHGVGMSQLGAIEMAKRGMTYRDILSFYYPGTTISRLKGDEYPMANKTVKASYQVKNFKQMADEKWKYVAGGHREGEVDCSGAFTYWYDKAGSTMYHGSNTIWREWCVEKGAIGEIDLVPGMAVFKKRKWSKTYKDNRWYNTEPGDVYHVGLYIGDGQVVEAKGTKYGVVYSCISQWHLCAKLKNTNYDIDGENPEVYDEWTGIVATNSGRLNLRAKPTTSSSSLALIPKGTEVRIVGETDGWYKAVYSGKAGYVSSKYIQKAVETPATLYTISFTMKDATRLNELITCLKEMGCDSLIVTGGD